MKKLRFLIIGVGAMGRLHIRRLRSVPEAEVVGLVNLSSAPIMLARRLFPELAATPVWSDYQTALREIEADAAIVATPHSWHFEHGMACLDAGLHVLMEKPLVSDSVKAAQLAHQAELNRKHLAVVYPYRLRDLLSTFGICSRQVNLATSCLSQPIRPKAGSEQQQIPGGRIQISPAEDNSTTPVVIFSIWCYG